MISLSECAPCKAMRLQAESEAEFRKRYGVVNARPAMKGWHPYLGQATAVYPSTGTVSAVARPYLDQVGERLLNFAGGSLLGFPVGIISNVAFKSLRRLRGEALTFASIASGVGLIAALLPIESPVMNTITRLSGILAGSAMSDVALPKKFIVPQPI